MITNRDLDLMGPWTLDVPAPVEPRPGPGGPGAPVPTPSAPVDEYVLVREGPPDEGWALQCLREGRVTVSTPLAPRGAAPRVRPAVAQAVAVRVLTERGVFVSGWNQVTTGPLELVRFVARRPVGADALPA